MSTLRFAQRAKKIKNAAKINKRRTRAQLEKRIIVLENANISLKKRLKQRKSSVVIKHFEQDQELLNANAEIERLKELLASKMDLIAQLNDDLQAKNEIIDEMGKRYLKEISQLKNENIEKTEKNESLSDQIANNEYGFHSLSIFIIFFSNFHTFLLSIF